MDLANMRRQGVSLVLGAFTFVFMCTTAHAQDSAIGLKTGRLWQNDRYTVQAVVVENHTPSFLDSVSVECSLYQGDQLVASRTVAIDNIKAGDTGSGEINAYNPIGATSAKCSIVKVR